MAADLHACVRDALGAFGIRGDLVADQEERRLRVVVLEDLQQPVGVGPRPVVERQRNAFDLRAVDVVGAFALGVAGEQRDHDDGDRGDDAEHHQAVLPGPAVASLRHGRSLPADC